MSSPSPELSAKSLTIKDSSEVVTQATTTSTKQQESYKLGLDVTIALYAISILFGGVGAGTAWAFTPIAPLAGALTLGSFGVSCITSIVICNLLDIKIDRRFELAMHIAVALVITNLIATFAFPYLGLAALTIQTATLFTLANLAGISTTLFTGSILTNQVSKWHHQKMIQVY